MLVEFAVASWFSGSLLAAYQSDSNVLGFFMVIQCGSQYDYKIIKTIQALPIFFTRKTFLSKYAVVKNEYEKFYDTALKS